MSDNYLIVDGERIDIPDEVVSKIRSMGLKKNEIRSNIDLFSINGGSYSMLAGDFCAKSAHLFLSYSSDYKHAIRVENLSGGKIIVRIISGDGPRSGLGNKDIEINNNSRCYIALYDSSRYVSMGEIKIDLLDEHGNELPGDLVPCIYIDSIVL